MSEMTPAQAAFDDLVPELRIAACPVEGHDGEHLQARTGGTWMCAQVLARAFAANGITADPDEISRLKLIIAEQNAAIRAWLDEGTEIRREHLRDWDARARGES